MAFDYNRKARQQQLLARADLLWKRVRHAGTPPARPTQRLIFSATNGRSGSDMLHRLFSAFDNLTTLHEPVPNFRFLRAQVVRDSALGRAWLAHVKLPAIAAAPGAVYVETSHMFCKGYLEAMRALEQPFDLVFLTRPAREIALSMIRLGFIPGNGPWAGCFYVAPDEPNHLPLSDVRGLSDYQLCYWHALENERRQDHYRALAAHDGRRQHTIATAELSDFDAVTGLFAAMDMDMDRLREDRLRALLGKRANTKTGDKRDIVFDPDKLADEEAQLRERAGIGGAPGGA